jgi:hypothetical protein
MEQLRRHGSDPGVRNATLGRLEDLARQPEQVEVEFGIRLNAAAGAVIAPTEAEGHLQLKLTWTQLKAGAADGGR